MQEVVEAFKTARPNVLDLARRAVAAAAAPAAAGNSGGDDEGGSAAGQPASKKRKVQNSENQEDGISRDGSLSEGRQTRSRSKRVEGQVQIAPVESVEDSQDEDLEPPGAPADPSYLPRSSFVELTILNPGDGLVACPICHRRMKNEAVFQHLDTCQGTSKPPKQSNFG